jgi:hypothetical protein
MVVEWDGSQLVSEIARLPGEFELAVCVVFVSD